MQPINLELLFHCRCENPRCDKWWTIADKVPPESTHCPHCGHINDVVIDSVEYLPYTGISHEEINKIIKVLENVIGSLKRGY